MPLLVTLADSLPVGCNLPCLSPRYCTLAPQELAGTQLEEERPEAAAAATAATAGGEALPMQALATAVPALPATPTSRPEPQRQVQRQVSGSEEEREARGGQAQLAT